MYGNHKTYYKQRKEENCNCRHKNNCPLDEKCLTPNIIYEAQITWDELNYKQKIYIGTAETEFKHRFNNHTKLFNLEHYENDTELSKEYWTIKRNHFTSKVSLRIIRKCTPFNTTNRKCYLCSMKSLKSLHTKKTVYLTKCKNLLTSIDTEKNSLFYSMIARTNFYVFTELFVVVFPLGPAFWPARLMFCILWFSKQKSTCSKQRFPWTILRGIFPEKAIRKWRYLFVWILLHCNFFVVCYYLCTKDRRKAWSFQYQNLVFSFLTYIINLLFPLIYFGFFQTFKD